MHSGRLFLGLFFLLTAGCAGVERAPPVEPSAARPAAESVVKGGSPDAETPARPSASPVPAAPPRKRGAPPPLDLTALETRLKETSAIGVFTKITLKNQVDDLLDQFRAYYQGRARTTLAELRQPYDRLLLKVLSLLQDGDPELARAIVMSREAIWSILADPVKFAAL